MLKGLLHKHSAYGRRTWRGAGASAGASASASAAFVRNIAHRARTVPEFETKVSAVKRESEVKRTLMKLNKNPGLFSTYRFNIVGYLREIDESQPKIEKFALGRISLRGSQLRYIFFSLLYTLHYMPSGDTKRLDDLTTVLSTENSAINLSKLAPASVQFEPLNVAAYAAKVQALVREYYGDKHGASLRTSPQFDERFAVLVRRFESVCTKFGTYEFADLLKWTQVYATSSVSEAVDILKDATLPPEFVLSFIMHRTPRTASELSMLLQIFKEYYDFLNVSDKRYCVQMLVEHCKRLNSHELPGLVQFYLEQFAGGVSWSGPGASGIGHTNFTKFDKTYLPNEDKVLEMFEINWLLWALVKQESEFLSKQYLHNVATTQQVVVQYLLKHCDGKTVGDHLSVLGSVSLALGVRKHPENSRKLIYEAEKHFYEFVDSCASYDPVRCKSLAARFYYAKLRCSNSRTELYNTLQEALQFAETKSKFCGLEKEPLLWRGFVFTLKELDGLTQDVVEVVIGKIVDKTIIINYENVSLLALLLSATRTRAVFEKLVQFYNDSRFNSSLVQEIVVQKMYKWAYEESSHEVLEKVRASFSKIRAPANSLVGKMLKGEALCTNLHGSATSVFDKYFEYKANPQGVPDSDWISALLIVSLRKFPDAVYGDMYCVQVAVSEMRILCARRYSETLTGLKIVPKNSLWYVYMEALEKYGYTDLLQELLEWWQELRYTPSRSLLIKYLNSIGDQRAARLLKHLKSGYDLSSGTAGIETWPWPSEYEIRAYKES